MSASAVKGFFRRPAVAATALLIVAGLAALNFQLRGHVPFSSDQAVIGLMAEDILDLGKHPVFCYGSEYGGTLEAHAIAAGFALAGRSVLVYRSVTCLFVLAIVIAVWWLTRIAYGERAAVFAGLYLAIGPAFYLYKMMTSDGSYVSLVFASACALAFLFLLDRRVERADPALAATVGLGFFAGLAWWQHSPSIFLAAPFAVWLLFSVGRRWLRVGNASALLASFLIGSWPWWWHNARHGWLSLHASELKVVAGDGFLVRIVELFTRGFPILLGAESLKLEREWLPGGRFVVWALLGLAVMVAVLDGSRPESPGIRRKALMLLAGLLAVPALTLSMQRTDFGEPRYLTTALVVLAPLLGRGLARLPVRISVVGLVGILVFNFGSEVAAIVPAGLVLGSAVPGASELNAWVASRGVRYSYSSYWTAYRMTFLSGGKLLSAPFGSGSNAFLRGDAQQRAVDASPAPAFLLETEDLARFKLYLRRRGAAAQSDRFSKYELFQGLPARVLEETRRCRCIPWAPRPDEVQDVALIAPRSLRAGQRGEARLRFHLNSAFPPTNNVRIGFNLRKLDSTVAENGVGRASFEAMGRDVDQRFGLAVPSVPGRYVLSVDLVDENVEWFSGPNGALAEAEILVMK